MGPGIVKLGYLFAAAASMLLSSTVGAQGSLFADDTVLNIELRGPVSSTIRDRDDRRERPFQLIYANQVVPVAVRVRGKSRAEYCRFPPLRISVPDSDASSTFADMGRIKLVTHCRDRDSDEQNVLEEFAAYQMFAMLSDKSLRTRLVRVRYVDTGRSNSVVERFAFLIEPVHVLAARVDGSPAESPQVVKSRLNLVQAADVFVFHYLISNTDWSLVTAHEESHCCHNGELLEVGEQNFIVPYDFDQSGLVSPRYARPDPSTRQRTVRSRLYRGYCFDDLDIRASIVRVAARRAEIESLLRSLPFSDERLAEKHIDYLGRFFEEAENPDILAAEFEKRCIG